MVPKPVKSYDADPTDRKLLFKLRSIGDRTKTALAIRSPHWLCHNCQLNKSDSRESRWSKTWHQNKCYLSFRWKRRMIWCVPFPMLTRAKIVVDNTDMMSAKLLTMLTRAKIVVDSTDMMSVKWLTMLTRAKIVIDHTNMMSAFPLSGKLFCRLKKFLDNKLFFSFVF